MATASKIRWIENAVPLPSTAARVIVVSRDADFSKTIRQILDAQNLAVQVCRSIPHSISYSSPGSTASAMLFSGPSLLGSSTAPSPLPSDSATAVASADLILLDCESTDSGEESSSGPTWMEVLRERGSGDSALAAPILLLPRADRVSEAVRALDLGAYDYLVQPFSKEQLVAAVHRGIEYHRLRSQNNLFRHHLERLIAARTHMLQQTMLQLEQSYDITLEALGNALDLKDAETEGHSKRVTAYALALGRYIGLGEPQLRVVGRGAFLHDIGKMAIPDAILRKPGKLTAEEKAIMRTHSELGYQMIRKIPFLREASEIVYSHQEYFDGSGYPRGLRGEQIHIGARIFALADTLDAITSNRPYRKANSIAAARKEVLRCAGTQFDPAIVDVFIATPDSIWQDLREGIMRDGAAFSPFGYTFGEVT